MSDVWEAINAEARASLPEEIVDWILTVRQQHRPESLLLEILHRLHALRGYLGQPQLDAVSHLLGVPAAKVTGVATFHHFFQLAPPGDHLVRICDGTSCYVRGAGKVIAALEGELGIRLGETTSDGRVTLQEAYCLGMCALSPVLLIDGHVHPRLTPDRARRLVSKIGV